MKKTFLRSAALVTTLTLLERFLGFFYRIFLSRAIGEEGMGYYSVALSLFAVLVTVVSSGIPATLSRLITKHKTQGNEKMEGASLSAGIVLSLSFALPSTLLLFFLSPHLSFLFSNEKAKDIFLILLFGLTFNAVYSTLRGYFWGKEEFFAYSFIELLEEAAMILCGVLLVKEVSSPLLGAKKAAVAVVVSYVVSFSLALVYFLVKGGKFSTPKGFRPLLSSALPITAMRTSSSLLNSLIAVLLPARLVTAGYSSGEALSLFGVAFGMAIPVLSIPTTLIGSFSLVLTPRLSEHYYSKHTLALKEDVEKSVSFTVIAVCLFMPFLFVFGSDMGYLLFASDKAGEMISRSFFMLLPMSITLISTSILNSLHLERNSLVHFLLGSALLLFCIWFLPKYLGVYSLILGFTLSHGLTAILDLRLLKKTCSASLSFLKPILKGVLLSAVSCLFGKLTYSLFLKLLSFLPAAFFTGILMVLFSLLLLALLNLLPMDAIKKVLKKKRRSIDRMPQKN